MKCNLYRKLLTLCGLIFALAASADGLYISDFNALPNTATTVSVNMKNTNVISGFQFDLVLPTGVTLNNAMVSSARTSYTYTVTQKKQNDGSIRILCVSKDAAAAVYTGTDGEVLTLSLTSTGTGNKTITLKSQILTESDLDELEPADATGTMHVHSLTATDAKDATCTATGNKAYWTCSGCEKYYSNSTATTETTLRDMTIPATGHKYTYANNNDGKTHTGTCSVCSGTVTEDHTYNTNNVCSKCSDVKVTGFTINATYPTIFVGQTSVLTATISPADATVKTIVWSSETPSVATVDAITGVVTAVSIGTAVITGTAANGTKVTFTITVGTPSAPAGTELVDLGLPSGTLWATMNVGAAKSTEAGNYYAWGEVQPKDSYTWATYKYGTGDKALTKYCTDSSYGTVDNKTQLDPEDDAAYVNWGSSWCMPTKEQEEELLKKCTWVYTIIDGVNGYNVTGVNGNDIFLPCTGLNGTSNPDYGTYWASTAYNNTYAYDLHFESLNLYSNASRYYGRSIRPVSATQTAIRVTSITLNKTKASMLMGKTTQLTATIAPTDAWDKTYEWSSSDKKVATVDADGNITTRGAGTSTITASAKDGSGVTATCELTVYLLGDVNNDKKVDVADVACLVSYLNGNKSAVVIEAAADVDEKNGITVADVVALKKIIMKLE